MPIPFLIGVFAAIGSAGTAAAAAVGTAVASTAVGSAVIGAATTIGTAVASSAVGTAAVGTMTAVGTGVGVIAGAASSLPVVGAAAGTVATITGGATGAAAVGAITTAGAIGTMSGISGAKKLSKAGNIKDEALSKFDSEREQFEKEQKTTNSALKKLGTDKLKIWQSFERFSIVYSKIKNPPIMNGRIGEESLTFSSDELNQVKAVAIGAKDLLSGGISSIAAGDLISFAATGGLVGAAQASTGIAVSSLSGAAATNAAMAALGGGSLAAGGAGMAGGAAVMGGLTVAPMLMVGGIMLNGKGNKALKTAKDIRTESNQAVEKMQESRKELSKVRSLANRIRTELACLSKIYDSYISQLEAIVSKNANYKKFSAEEKRALEKTILALKLLKQLSMQNILDPQKKNTILKEEVDNTLRNVKNNREEKLVA